MKVFWKKEKQIVTFADTDGKHINTMFIGSITFFDGIIFKIIISDLLLQFFEHEFYFKGRVGRRFPFIFCVSLR